MSLKVAQQWGEVQRIAIETLTGPYFSLPIVTDHWSVLREVLHHFLMLSKSIRRNSPIGLWHFSYDVIQCLYSLWIVVHKVIIAFYPCSLYRLLFSSSSGDLKEVFIISEIHFALNHFEKLCLLWFLLNDFKRMVHVQQLSPLDVSRKNSLKHSWILNTTHKWALIENIFITSRSHSVITCTKFLLIHYKRKKHVLWQVCKYMCIYFNSWLLCMYETYWICFESQYYYYFCFKYFKRNMYIIILNLCIRFRNPYL